MTAGEVIDQIERLTPEDRARVISFVCGLAPSPRLGGRELTLLAKELVDATDPVAAGVLKQRIAAGFYGDLADA